MSNKLIDLIDISKSYGMQKVLDELNLYIRENEFLTLLGPSGCGKTTTLRILGGFETPDKGRVIFDGQDITNFPANKRQLNTVFQKYALFTHMNIADNIAFGLKIKNKSKQYIYDKIKYALKLVNLDGFEKRMPDSLSGGQQQRIAIARAIVNEPKVLLLDEPLGALDLKLRQDMQYELIRLKNELGITFLYVTHDQEEAINMSDRIVVMNQGRFEQIGTPDEVYNHPKTSYVATFVGNANILKGKAKKVNGHLVQLQIGAKTAFIYTEESVKVGEVITFALRSENILLEEKKSVVGQENENETGNAVRNETGENTIGDLYGTVKEKNFAAGQLRVQLVLSDGTEITASRYGMNANIQPGQQIVWRFDPKAAVVVDRENSFSGEKP